MVQIIQNPAYSGGQVNPAGQSIAEAMNGIAGAFTPRAADIQGQLALFNAKQKLAAEGTIGEAIAKSADAQQDYAQDAPDYAAPQEGPTIDVNDPAGLGRAFMALGQSPGKALQTVSALQGGPKAPGVITGAIPDNTVKETPQYLDQAASAPKDLSAGSRLVNPITGATIAENPAADKDKYGVIGEVTDEFGRNRKIYGYPPEKPEKGAAPAPAPVIEGEEEPTSSSQAAAKVQTLPGVETVAGDKTPDVQFSPDQLARLQHVSPVLQGTVASIIQGRTTMPKLTGRLSPFTAMLYKSVYDVDPQFDAVNNQTQVTTRKSFAPSGNNNSPGVLIVNGDSALDHLAALKDASDKLPNLGSVVGPGVNIIAGATGGGVGGGYSAARTELDTKAQIASAEAIKYLAGATGGGENERDVLRQQFSSSNPPQSRLAAMQGLAEDILKKKQELQAGWRRSMGANAPDTEVISPTSQASILRLGMGKWASNGQPLDDIARKISTGFPTRQPTPWTVPGATPASPALQSAAPAGGTPQIRTYNPASGALE